EQQNPRRPQRKIAYVSSARAEAFVVDVFSDRRVFAAGRAGFVSAKLEGAEGHVHRVVLEQTTDEQVALPEQQLDGLRRLKHADDAGKDAQNAGLCARRSEVRGRGLGVQAA